MGSFDNLDEIEKAKKSKVRDTVIPRYHDTTTPVNTGTDNEHYARAVRNIVRHVGKESATLRLTSAEKDGLTDAIYDFRRQHINTTETEITRIGLNYILNDYTENGDTSILANVLRELNS